MVGVDKSKDKTMDNTITCVEDGMWSIKKAFCHVNCPLPNPVENSTPLDPTCNGNDMKLLKNSAMGTVCR